MLAKAIEGFVGLCGACLSTLKLLARKLGAVEAVGGKDRFAPTVPVLGLGLSPTGPRVERAKFGLARSSALLLS